MDDTFYCVQVAGEEVGDLLESLQVEESDTQANIATLTFGNSDLALSDILCEGLPITIDLGRIHAHTPIFRGIITGIRASFPSRGQPQVEVQATDSLIRLAFQPRTRRWWNKKISEIVEEIARSNNFSPGKIKLEADDTLQEMRPRQQIEETDLAFLLRLAKDYGAKLYTSYKEPADTLNLVSTQYLLDAEPIQESLIFNANLEEFSVSFDVFATVPEMCLVTTHVQTGKPVKIVEKLSQPGEAPWSPEPERIARLREGAERLSKLVAKTAIGRTRVSNFWRYPPREVGASSRFNSDHSRTLGDRSRRLGQMGEGRAEGSIVLRPRKLVKIEGYGERWSGAWYLAQVKHQLNIRQRSYISSFVCTR